MRNKAIAIASAVVIVFVLVAFFSILTRGGDARYDPGTEYFDPEAAYYDVPENREDLPPAMVPVTEAPTESSASWLTVHYLDVGQADCALLECGGEYLLIDGGNADDGRLVVSYLEQQGVTGLDTVICTHAHEDHVGGLAAVLNVYPVEKLYCPTRTYASRWFEAFLRYVHQQELEVTLPRPGETFSLGDARVEILGPLKSYADPNNTSIVCRVTLGETSFLFTGDMEKTAETDLLEAGTDLRADVLKVGHHGSDTSTGYWFLREVDPEYAVISVGRDNDYGHPHEQPMSRLYHAGMTIFRTDTLGTVIARSDGTEITFFWENQRAVPELAEYAGIYIGNKHSLRVHAEDCLNLPSERNRVEFLTLDQALEAGYAPCTACLAG